MLTIFGFEIPLPEPLAFLATPLGFLIVNLAAWILTAILVNLVLLRLLKFVTRQLEGDLEDIVLAILRGPLIILILLYGILSTLRSLDLPPEGMFLIERVGITILVLVVTHILGRTIRDVIVYYGERWALKTETRLDDVLVPVLNLFGPLLLLIAAALIILPMWGVDVNSVLVGAGVIGLVLGLALQETLNNIFGGLSLLMEGSFKVGDLIQLPDGRICEVLRLGMRSTMLFSLDEHATIYLPNKNLAADIIFNLTKPAPDQKYCIDVRVDSRANLAQVQQLLQKTASGHPAVLAANIPAKLPDVRAQIARIREQAEAASADESVRQMLLDEADRNERTLPRLEIEGELNLALKQLEDSLRKLIRGIKQREGKGLSEAERQEIFCNFVSPAENDVESVIKLANEWSEAEDAWLDHSDLWKMRKLWDLRNELLKERWEQVKKAVYKPDDRTEMRLDDLTGDMINWINREYKIVPGTWKDPAVTVKGFDGSGVTLQLWYYVDNIRLEHDNRPRRVRTEISRMIHAALIAADIWE